MSHFSACNGATVVVELMQLDTVYTLGIYLYEEMQTLCQKHVLCSDGL